MSEIYDLQRGIADSEQFIARRDKALKLYENPEFKELFVDEYFVNEAARLVQISSDPALDANQRADALAMAQATGHARRYLSIIVQMGNVAERDLPVMRETLDELRAEEGAE